MKTLSLVALAAAALVSTGAMAQDTTKVLTGKDAFGGWKDDAPGVTRHLTANDLEAPMASPSASNSAQPVPMPEGGKPKVPAGYDVELIAKGIDNPPLVMFVHGGGWTAGHKDLYQALGEAIARQGIACAPINTQLMPFGIRGSSRSA